MNARAEPMKIISPTLHGTILFTIAVFASVLIMSFVFRVEVVARGEGRVVPVGRVQVVQPEYSGRITAIHVRNGVSVEQGDVMIELDPTDALAELGTIRAEQERLRIEMARVRALVQALALDPTASGFVDAALGLYAVPDELASYPFAVKQRDLLSAELNDLLASFAQINAREQANRRSEEVTDANIGRVGAALEIQSERLRTSEQLLEQGTTSRLAFLDVQQAFTELERERDIYLKELEQKVAERTALDTERRRIITDKRSTSLDRLAQIDSRLATLNEEERATRQRIEASTLTAPASGVVDQLTVFTVGGVADAGAELMRVVPVEAEIEVEGMFSNQDIGFMRVGQQANLRLDAFPSERFGYVRGQISDIAADSSEVEGQWGYVVRIEPQQPYLEAGADRLSLRPGMTATIDVTTDTRRLIGYFFAPIVRTIEDAMGER